MNHFDYRDGALHAEGVPLADLAQTVGTPFYCYSTATLERHWQVFTEPFVPVDALVCFALKANSNQAVIRTLARLGAGADVVSAGELLRALDAGIPPSRIVFSGVGKTVDEMRLALRHGIYQFNVESEPELEQLSAVASAGGWCAPVTMRVNPDVDARTHPKISTGMSGNKFGVPWTRASAIYARARELPGIEVVGVDVHIGSQLTDLAPLEDAFSRVVGLVRQLRAEGHAISRLDLGGGLGVPYRRDQEDPPLPAAYGAMVRRLTDGLGCRLVLEPGRLIAANAGILVTRVLYVKDGAAKRFVVVDAAMNDLMRPALYDAWHHVDPVAEPAIGTPLAPVDVVGPVCESGDVLAAGRDLPPVGPGDLLVLHSAGAYGAVMASTYNTRPLVPEVMVHGDRWAVVRPRVPVEDLIALDRLPPWLEGARPVKAAGR